MKMSKSCWLKKKNKLTKKERMLRLGERNLLLGLLSGPLRDSIQRRGSLPPIGASCQRKL